jgi:hypothetical protein
MASSLYVSLYVPELGLARCGARNRASHVPCSSPVDAIPPARPAPDPAAHFRTTVRAKGETFQIVPILVIGILNETGVQSVPQNVYFSVFKIDERVA